MTTVSEKENKKEPVDIDQLEVSIFIIAKNPNQLKNAVQFLNRRDWPTTCIGNISKAIGDIVKNSPDIVLISVDHPNPNVARLPVLLAQTLNTICIGFTETGGALSLTILNKSKFAYKFTGFPSGPSIHRFIRQTLDKIYNPEEVSTAATGRTNSSEQENMTIQVKGNASQGAITIKGEGESAAYNNKTGQGLTQNEGNLGVRKKLKDIQGDNTQKPSHQMSAAEFLNKFNQSDVEEPISESKGYFPTGNDNKISDTNGELKNEKGYAGNGPEKTSSNKGYKDKIAENGSQEESKETNSYYKDLLENAGGVGKEQDKQKTIQEQLEEKKRAEEKKKRVEEKKKAFPWQKDIDKKETPIKDQKSRPGATFDLRQNRNAKEEGSDGAIQKGNKTKAHFEVQQGAKGKSGITLQESDKKGKKDFELGSSSKEKSSSMTETSNKAGGFDKATSESSENLSEKLTGEEQTLSIEKKNNEGKEEDSHENIKKRSQVSRKIVPATKEFNKEEDVFRETVNKALRDTCSEPDPNVVIRIEETEELGVIPIDSQKIHGYFFIGRGGIGFHLGTVFLDILAESIEKELALQGIDVHCQKPFLVQTDKFHFQEWAEAVENFTIFEQSKREEIALTFVPTKDRIPNLIDSNANPDMAIVQIHHISTENPLEFNSYLHLKKNGKFFLYIKEGNKMLPRQKDNLQKKSKNTDLHISKEDFEKFKKHVATTIIQDLIKAIKSNKGKKSA